MVAAMVREISIRCAETSTEFGSLYFGGGTPSLLSETELMQLLEAAHRFGRVNPEAEITLEANPEDINPGKLRVWKKAGINRLSIGLQSSHNDRLLWMNRSHSATEGSASVKMAQDAGFDNISIDLIFGYPGQDMAELSEDLSHFLALQTPHLSAYHLTLEPQTVFGRRFQKGELSALPEEESAALFIQVFDQLGNAGLPAYEISNFARLGFEAVHNRNYWLQKPFLGIGPSAHGFDGKLLRYANKPSNPAYLRSLENGQLCEEAEHMSASALANEFILTRLRMREGLPLDRFHTIFGKKLEEIRAVEIASAISNEWLKEDEHSLLLTRSGRLLADHIASELFTAEEDFDVLPS